ncbi:hypothetical protein Zmor_002430 [Zophobas morio]|uniref:Uncharacterized protein n=1 Tax=Zophobas morio TaxID=2755281 RepID=A0AA38JBJ3_9CUCU|nr:hypothetical protein Zmor_002430 [Zophobas morio]
MYNYYRTLKQQFILFSRLHKTISFYQLKRWFNQARIFCVRITPEDMEEVYKTFNLERFDYDTFEKFLEKLATQRKTYVSALTFKLVNCGIPDTVQMERPIFIVDRNKERKMEEEKELAKEMAAGIAKTAQEKSNKIKAIRKKMEMTGQTCNKRMSVKGEMGEFEKLIGDAYTSWECIPCIC